MREQRSGHNLLGVFDAEHPPLRVLFAEPALGFVLSEYEKRLKNLGAVTAADHRGRRG